MRKLKSLLLIAPLVLSLGMLTGCSNNAAGADEIDGLFVAGEFTGVGNGFGGEVVATVTTSYDEILDITITTEHETPGFGEPTAQTIIDAVLAHQGLDVDIVSGATYTSNGVIEAVTNALEAAGADLDVLRSIAAPHIGSVAQEELNVDVVVVGSGGAGLAAAVEVAEAGHSVVVLEKMPIIGGNTLRATGGFSAAGTSVQADNDVEDDADAFFESLNHEALDDDLLRILTNNSAEAWEWVNDLGADLTGFSAPRMHRPADGSPVGPAVVDALVARLDELDIEIMTNTKALELIKENGRVVGLKADANGNDLTVNAQAVILATGGFGASSEMLEIYRADLIDLNTTKSAGSLGTGIQMAVEVGADVLNMEEMVVHPTTDPETGFMFSIALRSDGGILLNNEGRRFTNELAPSNAVTADSMQQPDGITNLIVNQNIADNNATVRALIGAGWAQEAQDLSQLADMLDVDLDVLEETFTTYRRFAENGEDEDFGRPMMNETFKSTSNISANCDKSCAS
ncbi:MAG: FAD-dependent oxidoreductase, partial [Streptococcaceae bacterium]|nr:FAD-dependent oxidoreductase [Streptococcaceae bacterium]